MAIELTNEECSEFRSAFKKYAVARKTHKEEITEEWIDKHLSPLPKGRAFDALTIMMAHWSSRYTVKQEESQNEGHINICIIDRASAQ